MAQGRDAQREPELLVVVLEIARQLFRALYLAPSATTTMACALPRSYASRIRRRAPPAWSRIRDADRLSATGNPGHEGWYPLSRPMTSTRNARPCEDARLSAGRWPQRDVQRGVDADRDLRAIQVVVDGRGHADHRKPILCSSYAPDCEPLPPITTRASISCWFSSRIALRRPSSVLNSGQRALPRIVPPCWMMPPTLRGPISRSRRLAGRSNRARPRRLPIRNPGRCAQPRESRHYTGASRRWSELQYVSCVCSPLEAIFSARHTIRAMLAGAGTRDTALEPMPRQSVVVPIS